MSMAGSTKAETEIIVLELKIRSGEGLKPRAWSRVMSLGRVMRTYAAVWINNPAMAQRTPINTLVGSSNPTWNHTFTLNVSTKFMSDINSQIQIGIYSTATGLMTTKDRCIGTYTLLVKEIPTYTCSSFSHKDLKRVTKAGKIRRADLINFYTNVRIPYTEHQLKRVKQVTKNCTESAISLEEFNISKDSTFRLWVVDLCGHRFHEVCMDSLYNKQATALVLLVVWFFILVT